MARVEFCTVASFLQELLKLGSKVGILDELSLRECERWGVWASINSAEQSVHVPDRVHGRVAVPRHWNDHISSTKVVGLAVTKINIYNIVFYIN